MISERDMAIQEGDAKSNEKTPEIIDFKYFKVLGSGKNLQTNGGNLKIQSGRENSFNLAIHLFFFSSFKLTCL